MPLMGPQAAAALKSCRLTPGQLRGVFKLVLETRIKIATLVPGPKTQHLNWNILLYVAENHLSERELSKSDIYNLHGASKSTVVSAMNTMAKRGHFKFSKSFDDKRRTAVVLDDALFARIIREFSTYAIDIKNIIEQE